MHSKLQKSILKKSTKLLDKVLTAAEVPESHGLGHALKVLANLHKAIESNAESGKTIRLAPERELAL